VVTLSKETVIRLSVNVTRKIQLAFLTGARSEGTQMPGDTRRVRDKARRRTLQYNFQRPLSLPPGTPKERLVMLRKAFKATLKDPQFLAEAKKSKLIITYVSGKQVEKNIDQILAISPEAKEALQFLVKKPKKKKK